MISNAVANTPNSSVPSRPGQAGRTSGEADNAFRDVLDKSAKADVEASGTEAAEAKPRTVLADTRWQSTLENMVEEQPSEGDAEADASGSGDELIESAEGQVQEAVGEQLPCQPAAAPGAGPQPLPEADGAADKAPAEQSAHAVGVAAKSVSPNAAKGLAIANEVAGENARLPAKGLVQDGQPVPDAEGADETAANAPARRSVDVQPTNPERAATADRGVSNIPAGNTAAGPGGNQPVAAAPVQRNSQAGLPEKPVVPAVEDRSALSGIRTAGDMQPEQRRVSNESAGAVARPSAEPAAAAVKTTGSPELLREPADIPASRQVAEAVAREIEELAPSRLTLNGATAQGGRTVKSMRLQLNPAELGAVNIRMQSVDGELRVTIQADSDQTTRMLHNDADAIRSALRAAGISGADVVISSNRNDSAQSQNFNAQQRDPSGQQMGAHENRQNASNESRQSYRESSSHDSVPGQAHSGDAGDNSVNRGRRIVI